MMDFQLHLVGDLFGSLMQEKISQVNSRLSGVWQKHRATCTTSKAIAYFLKMILIETTCNQCHNAKPVTRFTCTCLQSKGTVNHQSFMVGI